MLGHDVGDILWIIHSDRPGLMAYQVIEEVIKKTMDGQQTHYLVKPASAKAKPNRLSSIKGRIFKNSSEAKEALLENATKAIEGIIKKTQSNVETFFVNQQETNGISKKDKIVSVENVKKETLPIGYQWVEMEDGKQVKMKIPEGLLL